MRGPASLPALLALLLAAAPAGAAASYPGGVLTALQPGGISFLADGTSRTILVGETTRVAACFDEATGTAPLSDIADGTSNTISFGENRYLTLLVGQSLQRQPIGGISDGTSNTIFIGKDLADERCFGGETSIVDIGNAIVDGSSNTIFIGEATRFDLCFRNARFASVADGSSNTILFGETSPEAVCFNDVRIAGSAVVSVPEPSSVALFGAGLLGVGLWRRIRLSSTSPANVILKRE